MGDEPREVELSDDERRLLTRWAVACAERALPLFEAGAPGDARPRETVEAARAYAFGDRRTKRLRTAAWASTAAARDADDGGLVAAARAAAAAAGAPYIHALATPHQVKHIHGPALYLALAREAAAGGDPAAGEAEVRWAIEHAPPGLREIVRRFPAGDLGDGRTRQSRLRRLLDEGLRG
ncbi:MULTISPECIES: putative immunity protein [unclassified Nocardiopsis]|uniref:putative immunity protein n=1 Tax=Nocardiopsis TaxID=2013 RepID=UPI00387B4768